MATLYPSLGVSTQDIDNTDSLFAGEFRRVEKAVTLVFSGAATIKRGTVLGKVTASGKYKAYSNAASDGTETAVAILGVDVTASGAGDIPAFVYVTGEFNENALTGFDSNARPELEALNIYVKKVN